MKGTYFYEEHIKKGDCKNGRRYEEVTFCILLPV